MKSLVGILLLNKVKNYDLVFYSKIKLKDFIYSFIILAN